MRVCSCILNVLKGDQVPTFKVSDLLQDVVEEATATSWDTYPEVAGSSLQRIFRGSVVMFVSEDAGVAKRRTFRVEGEGCPHGVRRYSVRSFRNIR